MNQPMQRYDVHSCFARVHLTTRAERAVYFTLVAQLAESWSATELARLKNLDVRTVEAVLDRYSVAGIVEVADVPMGGRYQWRSDMSYLFGSGPSGGKLVDPVCGMAVDGWTPYCFEDAFQRLWMFCAPVCMTTFQAAPQAFRSAAEAR